MHVCERNRVEVLLPGSVVAASAAYFPPLSRELAPRRPVQCTRRRAALAIEPAAPSLPSRAVSKRQLDSGAIPSAHRAFVDSTRWHVDELRRGSNSIGSASCVALVAAGLGASAPATSDERVTLYATAAALSPDGSEWLVPIHFEVFEPEYDDPMRTALLEPLRRKLAVVEDSAAALRFRDRAKLFLIDHERGEQRVFTVTGRAFELGPTEPNGHSRAELRLDTAAVDLHSPATGSGAPRWLDIAVGTPGAIDAAATRIALIGPEGLSVISDLDDTLKITEVHDRLRVLQRTFLEEFEPVPGMAALCQRLAARGAAFHYVSLSPWQLAGLFEEFFAAYGFPAGALELQHFRLQDGDFADLIGDSRAKKLAVLEPLLARWPQRRFVLIGDSGQSDPEVYGELARRHKEQIAAIWIRVLPAPTARAKAPAERPAHPSADPTTGEVVGAESDGDTDRVRERLLAARCAIAFADLPSDSWTLFTDPATLTLPE
ncbi:MAG: DUF2183 domain-containing protein [Planctomycetes bacterium]|nr:DUF2183 domain-containing protein [Planctomycetota bacterium]